MRAVALHLDFVAEETIDIGNKRGNNSNFLGPQTLISGSFSAPLVSLLNILNKDY